MKKNRFALHCLLASFLAVGSLALPGNLAQANTAVEGFGITLTKTLGTDEQTKGNGFQQTADDGFVIAGSIGSSASIPYLLKVDNRGEKQWEQRYPAFANTALFTVLPLQNGGYFAAGLQHAKDTSPLLFMMSVDEHGKLLWTQTYKTIAEAPESPPSAAFETSDHSVVVTGQGFALLVDQVGKLGWQYADPAIKGISAITENVTGQVTLEGAGLHVTIDRQGKKLQATVSPHADTFQAAARLVDGGYVYVNKFTDRIIKVDKSGSLVWEKNRDIDLYSATMIEGTADGGFALISTMGQTYMIHKFDVKGNRMGNARIGTSGKNEVQTFSSAIETKDGSYALIAYHINEAPKNSDILLYKTNSFETAKVQSLSIVPSEKTIMVGKASRVKLLATMLDGSVKDVTAQANWSSDDEEHITVEKGKVTGVQAGIGKVVAIYDEIGITCELLIQPAK
ncbi:hypothetical protein EDM56_17500 [Brevibacillus fluminis]|uniref:BIG2 domain-containing protein n=1 Tax=Brevibacillus fluminis TaxID=511487 RepID=A0A3M8DJ90_9BACL|nr:hypothetical protein [Brevibacillus fluminis]RNB87445.1 hypothetical protein EDM56_17500 [Brevibacillus fluminis]